MKVTVGLSASVEEKNCGVCAIADEAGALTHMREAINARQELTVCRVCCDRLSEYIKRKRQLAA